MPPLLVRARRKATRRVFAGLVVVAWTLLGGLHATAQEPEALTANQVERTERFLTTRAACLGCHRLSGVGGAIGPTLDGVSDRLELEYVIRMIRAPRETLPGTIMPHQPMPEREATRLARYLMTRPPVGAMDPPSGAPEAPPALEPGQESDGEALYARHCAACHGGSGAGDGWNAANLPVQPTVHSDPRMMSVRPDDSLYDAIFAGGYVLDKSPLMPAFGNMLAPSQIRALVAHIRTLCACDQPAWARGGRG